MSPKLSVRILSAAFVLGGVVATRPARADCGDFAGLGYFFAGTVAAFSVVGGGFTYPAIAVAANPELSYFPGVGYTLAAGAGTAGITALVVGRKHCPESSELLAPAVVPIPVGILTTAIWAFTTDTEPSGDVAMFVAPPQRGHGALIGIGGRL